MNWKDHQLESRSTDMNLPSRIDALLAHQRVHWGLLNDGERALSTARTKVLTQDGARVIVQENPVRRRSVHAKTDPHSIAHRACFLCPENLPAEERGIAFGPWVILPNPYPIVRRHGTIVDCVHRPQRLAGRIEAMLEFARLLGPDMLVFYNGPESGASAPDHMHFQTCDAQGIPVLDELRLDRDTPRRRCHATFGRRMFIFSDTQAKSIEESISQSLDLLSQRGTSSGEPMFNLLAIFTSDRYVAILFPRASHRPTCYFAEGSAQLAISPGALEMAGILVVAEPNSLNRVSASTVRTIYDEVCLDEPQFDRWVRAVLS